MTVAIPVIIIILSIVILVFFTRFFKNFNLADRAQKWDGAFNLPRPANEQYLSSEKAFLKLLRDYFLVFIYFIAGMVSFLCLLNIWLKLGELGVSSDSPLRTIPFLFVIVLMSVFIFVDINIILLPYRGEFQRQTLGTARWASVSALKSKNLLMPKDAPPTAKAIPLVPFGAKYFFSMAVGVLAHHLIIIGASGSGKTKSIFLNLVRKFSFVGGQVILDIKSEISDYSCAYMSDIFRADFDNPAKSDFWDLFGPCRGNPVIAAQVAQYIIGETHSKSDPFWDDSARLMLKCLILHLCSIKDYPTPSDIIDFLYAHPTEFVDTRTGEERNLLTEAMENSNAPGVKEEWVSFFNLVGKSPKTLGSIGGVMLAKLNPFRDPKVAAVMRPPTIEEENLGRRKIDFLSLRKMKTGWHKDGIKRGGAIYVVVKEADARRLKTVISTFFSMGKDILKQEFDEQNDCHVIFQIDEAGNVPMSGLSEDYGVGRGRGLIFNLGFQGISQLANLYGQEVAKTIFENTGTYIIVPPAKDNTADWVCKMLSKTTALTRSSADAVNNSFDTEKLSEQSRDLMFPNEIREMKKYCQTIVLHDDAPPIRAGFPVNALELDTRRFEASQKMILPDGEWLHPPIISGTKTSAKEIADQNSKRLPPINRQPVFGKPIVIDERFAPFSNGNQQDIQVESADGADKSSQISVTENEEFDLPLGIPDGADDSDGVFSLE